jgi:aspartyl-tRNA(Asn)/glutamyl-tRNA(Gln) amidotransferase subunit C
MACAFSFCKLTASLPSAAPLFPTTFFPAMSAAAIDIHHVAKLSRLTLTPEEATHYQQQLSSVLDYIATLTAHDLGEVQPTAHAMPVHDVMRVDECRSGFSQEECLSNAPKRVGDQFQIPKVIE